MNTATRRRKRSGEKPVYDELTADAFNALVLSTALHIRGIDTFKVEQHWDRIPKNVLNDPRAVKHLDMGMEAMCKGHGMIWDRDKGPWYYSVGPWR